MVKLAQITNGVVDNVIVGEPAQFPDLTDVTGKRVAPGYIDNGDGTFSPPPAPPPSWDSTLEFLREFTRQERINIRAAAKQDPVVEDFMEMLEKADGVDSTDSDVTEGMQYLVDNGHLSSTRRDEILGDT